ncbi:DotU family type IV/VI secretion system protein [Pseudomonas sp. N040]|uniref:DotU family type IV/VI secretion system protein n=1 Tax=Pseudomonas sp. N040 TaxID=2785325 RepID=UPI0018A2F506|nr:DotU family type IV/VI secretion system protein [Pseudomonas sp. N040]MBF7729556.1 DotU family type IV/VI secretion system protein [Pseudomonas sp. N040]MBW7013196.1 DotU family type IV/VI secretion system protein [Pseudomonas sp. N040]
MTVTRLVDCWMGVFDAAKAGFADSTQTQESLSARLIALLDQAGNRAREHQFAEAEIREALFAMVAWVDESAMSRNWPGADAWRRAPMQRHYFSTSRAGVEFFQRLEALPEAAQGAREVFGLVLLSGFQGRYATRPGGELTNYRRQLLERIVLDNQMPPLDAFSHLFPQPPNNLPQRAMHLRRGLPGIALVLLVVLPLLALAALYLGFDMALGQQVADILRVR